MDSQKMLDDLREEFRKILVGQDRTIEELVISFFTGGHVILEGVPGTAKTLIVKTLSHIVGGEFRRIQFTPDLMPSDVVGTHIYDMKNNQFHLQKGPVFTNFLLADEINRTPPKTQAALLEAMEERQVTIEGETQALPETFMVCATQNPLEFEGTYPLPEAQLDRFMMKIIVSYPEFREEREIIRKFHLGFSPHNLEAYGLKVLEEARVRAVHEEIRQISVSDPLIDYMTEIIHGSRKDSHLNMGASPRGGIHLLLCSKTSAALKGRDYVIPDDVKAVAYPVLRHRIILKPEAEIEGISPDDVIGNILSTVNVPR